MLAPLSYRLQVGDTQTPVYRVKVYERPTVLAVDGSDVYVVYTDARDTFGPRSALLMNRGLAVKATRLLRF